MRGKQRRDEPLFAMVRLEELVPQDHLLRGVDRHIDFSCVEQQTRDLYSPTGRPSIDPEVLIRMMVLGYLHGITSERRLCQEVQVNLAYRWFCGLSLEDKVPDHSTFSKNRHGRFAETDIFRALFYAVVKQAQAKGLVRGRHLTVDATTLQANAALSSMEPVVVPFTAQEYLERVEQENLVEAAEPPKKGKLSNATHRSRTDPDARLFSKPFHKTMLAYSHNVLMDNASRVIVDVQVTEPNLNQEGQVAGEMIERTRFALGIAPQTLGGDKAYGYGPAVRRIAEAGVVVHAPASVQGQRNAEGIFGKEEFSYDAEHDELICPNGKRLKKRTEHHHNRQTEYAARESDCQACSMKSQCTRSQYRVTHRHGDQEELDAAAEARTTLAYRISQRFRKDVEKLFGEAKEQMGLRRARRHGYRHVTEQCLMTAMVQNIKRILRAIGTGPRPVVAAFVSGFARLCNGLLTLADGVMRLRQITGRCSVVTQHA